jgi:hypothetical protein
VALLGAGVTAGISGVLGQLVVFWLCLVAINLIALLLLAPMFTDRFKWGGKGQAQ